MADVLLSVAAAISMGAILIAPTHSVGPYRVAVQTEAQWACLDKQGVPVVAVEEWTEMDPYFTPAGKPFPLASGQRVESRQDWSAFGAARMFVSCVGPAAAMRALRRARGEDESAATRPVLSAKAEPPAIARGEGVTGIDSQPGGGSEEPGAIPVPEAG